MVELKQKVGEWKGKIREKDKRRKKEKRMDQKKKKRKFYQK